MIRIKKQGAFGRLGDMLMVPIMYALQVHIFELPQRTHRWNNMHLSLEQVTHLDARFLVSIEADPQATPRWKFLLPIFHMPFLGGWRNFVVFEPTVPQDEWFIGWIAGDLVGVSRVPLSRSVRLLRCPTHAFIFGLNEHGEQIQTIGQGVIGKAGVFYRVPLL
jgi:hypothetical protein